MSELSWLDWVMAVVAVLMMIWVIRQAMLYRREQKEVRRRESITSDPFDVSVDHGDVLVRIDAGSWMDYGLRQDLNVSGIKTITLEGRDRDRNMLLRLTLERGEDAELVALKIQAMHSIRKNPTTDWRERDDFNFLVEHWDG